MRLHLCLTLLPFLQLGLTAAGSTAAPSADPQEDSSTAAGTTAAPSADPKEDSSTAAGTTAAPSADPEEDSSTAAGTTPAPPADPEEDSAKFYKILKSKSCVGEQTEYDSCPDLTSCKARCTPKDCTFNDWSSWGGPGNGCSGVCSRERHKKVSNNECGKPCTGPIMMTKMCTPPSHCLRPKKDCVLGDWKAWDDSACESKVQGSVGQKQRVRQIKQDAINGGELCVGALRQTEPCVEPPAKVDCETTTWTSWTDCTRSCGFGIQYRKRKIKANLQHKGEGCSDSLNEEKVCNAEPCTTKKDCSISEWGEWDTCNKWNQQTRSKNVTEAVDGGSLCKLPALYTEGGIQEVRPCDFTPPIDCVLGDWGKFEKCDKSCDGGQKLRTRAMSSPPKNGGKCNGALDETAACGADRCMSTGESDCELMDWEEWGACSAQCGPGVRKRQVKGIIKMKAGGKSCKDTTAQVGICEEKSCEKTDCVWDDWGPFEPCSVTCGGGFKRHERRIKVSPRGGGKGCPATQKLEVVPCTMESCLPPCKDGEWDKWGNWSDCSVDCGSGYSSRGRAVKTEQNYCGWPVTGAKEEFRICTGKQGPTCEKDQDCKVSEWSKWGACSATCFGLQTSSRTITQIATANGMGCNDLALKRQQACSPVSGEPPASGCGTKLPPRDCELSDWGKWQECSSKCNGGQKLRTRSILSPPQNYGKSCDTRLQETDSCNMMECQDTNCVDCELSPWRSWGACSPAGQKVRSRDVKTYPNYCGKKCPSQVSAQVEACSVVSASRYCAWGEWSTFAKSEACTESRKRRSRSLVVHQESKPGDYLFKMTESTIAACFGTQFVSQAVNMTECKPQCTAVDCKLSGWDDWSAPMGYGLCKRQRTIDMANNECGEWCGKAIVDLEQTKACLMSREAIDCRMSSWSDWTGGTNFGVCKGSPEALSYRMRYVRGDPRNGGKECLGNLKEMRSCVSFESPVDCAFTDWSLWATCDVHQSPFKGKDGVPCGKGHNSRSRRIGMTSQAGGKSCTGPLREVAECSGPPCRWDNTSDCEWNDWQEWDTQCTDAQQKRTRSYEPAVSNGVPCKGAAKEMKACEYKAVDCKLEDWNSWSSCSLPCRGRRKRSREMVTRHAHWGKVCGASFPGIATDETEDCNDDKSLCKDEEGCQYGEWAKWNCAVTCGFAGQAIRHREVSSLRKIDGIGCTGELSETGGCKDLPPCHKVDCLWGDWRTWSGCSKSCGQGQQTRTRNLKDAPLGPGAKSCPVSDMEQQAPCKKEDCPGADCVDASWDDWSAWTGCSASCGMGVIDRKRVIKQEANYCGNPVTGRSQETASCENNSKCPEDVDCKLGDWQEWYSCSASCDGTKRRIRSIKTRAVGAGKACGCIGSACDTNSSSAALEETAPCNPSKNAKGCPVSGIPLDCDLSKWSEWTKCAVTCGAAQKDRSRTVHTEAVNGGKACDPMLTQTSSCGLHPCDRSGMKPLDCAWSKWTDWGACDDTSCDVTIERTRSVTKHAQYGGKNCTGDSSREIATCSKGCLQTQVCRWDAWADWSKCDIDCIPEERKGLPAGYRARKRSLTVHSAPVTTTTTPAPTTTEEEATSTSSEAESSSKEGTSSSSSDTSSKEPAKASSSSASSGSKETKQTAALYEADEASPGLDSKVQELYRRAQNVDSRRWQEVSAAFALGCLSFLVAFGVFPRCARPRSTSRALQAAAGAAETRDEESYQQLQPSRQQVLL